jgi:hypothetical protein
MSNRPKNFVRNSSRQRPRAEPARIPFWIWASFVSAVFAGAWWMFGRGGGSSQRTPARGATEETAAAERARRVEPNAQRRTGTSEWTALTQASLSGVVLGTGGNPLANASVCAVGTSNVDGAALCVSTDASGQFTLSAVSSDVSALLATAAGYLARRHPLGAHGDAKLTIRLERGGAELSGSVVDATGGAVPGALVTVRSVPELATLAAIFSDAGGRFSLHVPPVEVEVGAEAEAYSRAVSQVHAPVRDVTLVIAPAAQLAGKVVVEGTGAPLPEMTVVARSVNGAAESSREARSDGDGEFRLTGLMGGSYELSASNAHWATDKQSVTAGVGAESAGVVLHASPATTLNGTVERGGKACPEAYVQLDGAAGSIVRFASAAGSVQFEGVLPGGYRVTVNCPQTLSQTESLEIGTEPVQRHWELQSGLTIQGRVQTPSGQPVKNVGVHVRAWGDPPGRADGSCMTDSAGAFLCAGLSSGAYDCSVDERQQAAGAATRVVLREESAANVLLRTAASASIRITLSAQDPDTARPSKVFARSGNSLREAVPEGNEFVFDGMPLGRHEVYVDLPSHSSEVVLERDGQVALLTLSVPPSTPIRGRVLDGNGAPIVDAWVRASPNNPFAGDPDYGRDRPALTDDTGQFTLAGLAPGSYDLQVESSAGKAHARGVQAGSGAVLLRVQAPAGLSGDVLARSGAVVEAFTLSYEQTDGTTASVDGHEGHWEIAGLEPGSYHLSVTSAEGAASRDVVLQAGVKASATLILEPAGQTASAER